MIRIHDLKIYEDIATTDVFEIAIKKAKIKKSDVMYIYESPAPCRCMVTVWLPRERN